MPTYMRCNDCLLYTSAQGKRYENREVVSVFFGGGTPTALEIPMLAQLMQAIRESSVSYTHLSSLAIKTLIKNHVSSIYILFKSKLIFLNSKSPINFYG